MEDDLIVKYYSEKQYFALIQHITNNEIPINHKYYQSEYYETFISEVYLFSLLRNNKDIDFMHNNLNLKKTYSYYSDINNHRKLYKYDTIIDFGMYKWSSINDVAKIDPAYVFWCIENIADFYVEPEILMKIILSNNSLPLKTVELNILKSDCINIYHRHGYIKERLIIPWKIEIEHLKTYYNKSKEIIQKYEDDINELDNAEGINEDDYNNYQDNINSQYEKEIKYFKFLNRILFLYHKHGNADYRYY
jgi:hypothetical protein